MVGQIWHPHVVHVELGRPWRRGSPRTRRIASRQLAMARSTCGRPDTWPDSSRTTTIWRTWARATRRVVLGVVLGDALVEQDVLGRLEPGHVEGREAPQVEAAPDHRVHAADEAVLDERAVDRAEGEVADRAAPARADGDGDAAHVLGEGQLLEQRGELRRWPRRGTRARPASAGRGRRPTGAPWRATTRRWRRPRRARCPARARRRRRSSTSGGSVGRRGCSRRRRRAGRPRRRCAGRAARARGSAA